MRTAFFVIRIFMGKSLSIVDASGVSIRARGARTICRRFIPISQFEEKIGEAWLTGDDCKVANGPLTGQTLAQVSEKYQRELVGDAARDAQPFPFAAEVSFSA